MLGTGPLMRHAHQNSWDKPALGTCPLKCLGKAGSLLTPFNKAWDRPALGTSPYIYPSLPPTCLRATQLYPHWIYMYKYGHIARGSHSSLSLREPLNLIPSGGAQSHPHWSHSTLSPLESLNPYPHAIGATQSTSLRNAFYYRYRYNGLEGSDFFAL